MYKKLYISLRIYRANIIIKLRTQNDHLRKQIKDLNTKHANTLEAMNKKGKPKSEQIPASSEAVLKKQLQSAYKQIENYKKQIQIYNDKGDVEDLSEKYIFKFVI